MWRVTRDDQVLSFYWTDGDARRGACLKANGSRPRAGAVRVLTPCGGAALRRNEPQFGR